MIDRSSVTKDRLRRLTMALGALGSLGVIVAWLATYLSVRSVGMLTVSFLGYFVFAIIGAIPFLLVTFGCPRRPLVSLIVCLILLGLNSYLYVLALVSDSDFAGLNAIGAVFYSWVVWGAGMMVDNWNREPAGSHALPPRPDRH